MPLRAFFAGVVLPLVAWVLLAPTAAPGASLTDVQQKIQSTQGKLGAKRGRARVLTTQISAYNRKIEGLQDDIAAATSKQTELQSDLDVKTAVLSRTKGELRVQRGRIVTLRHKLREDRAVLARRLVELYQSDRPDLMSVVFNAKGFADLLEREEFIARISRQDRRVIANVRDGQVAARALSERLTALQLRQQRVASEMLRRRDEIAAVKDDLVGTRVGYARAKTERGRALADVREDTRVLEGDLGDLQATEAKIRAALAGPSVGTLPAGAIRQGSGQLIWPVNGPITSPFCERRAWEACHPGVDIAVASGTPIRAAAAGTVALTQGSGGSGGYGNFTCVAHTTTMSTCYAHQSSIGVAVGQHVSQGQIIGVSGCTGRCYGAHLHFEVRLNGAVTNPLGYL